jgi:hypothetical protein
MLAKVVFVSIGVRIRFLFGLVGVLIFFLFLFGSEVIDFYILLFSHAAIASGRLGVTEIS